MPHFLRILFSLLLLAACTLTSAMERPFPANAKRGMFSPDLYPALILDGKSRLFAANVQVRNRKNMIQTPASLPPGTYPVLYLDDRAGQINKVWILTEQEATNPRLIKGANGPEAGTDPRRQP